MSIYLKVGDIFCYAHTNFLEISVKFWVFHKNDFYVVIPDFCQIFPELPAQIFFSKISMGNVRARGIIKNIPNLQVYEHTPATPTTLSIKVVIVVLY